MHDSEAKGTIAIMIFMTLAVVSGIGGGGIVVSLLMHYYKLSTREAIAVSGFTIFVGSSTRFIITYQQRHPEKDATIVDYSLTNIMLPCVMVGSLIGIFFNLTLPNLVI